MNQQPTRYGRKTVKTCFSLIRFPNISDHLTSILCTAMYTTLVRNMPSFSRRMVRLNTLNLGFPTQSISPALPVFSSRAFSWTTFARSKEMFTITYELGGGEKHTVQAKDGDNLLDVVINNDVDIDGFGACEGTLACSTCHIVFTEEVETLFYKLLVILIKIVRILLN